MFNSRLKKRITQLEKMSDINSKIVSELCKADDLNSDSISKIFDIVKNITKN